MKTYIGGALSIALIYLILIYAANKFIEMSDRKFPILQEQKNKEYFNSEGT